MKTATQTKVNAKEKATARAKKAKGTGATKVKAKNEKEILMEAVSVLKKSMAAYKKERKSDWKLFKVKFKADMDIIKESLKKMALNHKKPHLKKSK